MDTIPIITVNDVKEIDAVLHSYLDQSEAGLAILIDKGGSILSQQGKFDAGDTVIVAALAAGSFAATRELARRIGEKEFAALFHQGESSHLFIQAVDEDHVLVTIFENQTTAGLVRIYSARCAARLAAIVARMRQRPKEEGFTFDPKEIEKAGKLFGN